MTATPRGPTGTARPPPDRLHATRLPLTILPASSTLVRIHHSNRSPIFFSPGADKPPLGRFDSAAGLFGVLYAAMDFDGAFAETLLRNPERHIVGAAEIAARSIAVLAVSRALRLVPLHGPALSGLGLDNAITTGPYEPCGLWADALFIHPDSPDGIIYPSRHDPEKSCVALFSRPDMSITLASDSVKLSDIIADVARSLRRYGKGLDR
jgi:RES domain-containing protein